MTMTAPTILGEVISRSTDQTTSLTFQNCYEAALRRARLSILDTDLLVEAKELVNEMHETLCMMVPEAPFMRKVTRFTTDPAIDGFLLTLTNASATATLDATEALTAAQVTLYPGSRIHNPTVQEYHFINAIGSTTSITLDTAWAGDTVEGGWEIFRDIYKLPADFGRLVSIESPTGQPSLEYKGDVELRELLYMGVRVGTPQYYSFVYHGDGVRRIMLMDAPSEALVYTITYNLQLARMTDDAAIPYLPVAYRQMLVYGPASILALTQREDPELANGLAAMYGPMYNKFIAEYAPERTKLRLRLPESNRPWRPRRMAGAASQVTASWWSKQ